MLAIHYEGWCQIRLATNPDPTDEPRGASGYSFAFAGEPDFDRAVRFQNPVAPRVPGPEVGVTVREVRLNGEVLADHPLLGADAELLGDNGEPPAHPRDPQGPRFEARNYIIAEPGIEPLWPFHIRFSRGEAHLERRAEFAAPWTGEPIYKVPLEEVRRFGAVSAIRSSIVAEATGITDPEAFRLARREAVRQRAESETDPVARLALEQRLVELERSPDPESLEGDHVHVRTLALTAIQQRDFELTGTSAVAGLAEAVDESEPWRTSFWFGGWDCDALCCYTRGFVLVPLKA